MTFTLTLAQIFRVRETVTEICGQFQLNISWIFIDGKDKKTHSHSGYDVTSPPVMLSPPLSHSSPLSISLYIYIYISLSLYLSHYLSISLSLSISLFLSPLSLPLSLSTRISREVFNSISSSKYYHKLYMQMISKLINPYPVEPISHYLYVLLRQCRNVGRVISL